MFGLPAGSSSSTDSSSSLSFARSFDAFAYKRFTDIVHFTEATKLGAILTLLATFFISFLFIAELLAYLTVHTLVSVHVPSSGYSENKPIPVTFNITFPRLPCSLISIEGYDTLSVVPKNLLSSVHRYKIDSTTGTALMRILHTEANGILADNDVTTTSDNLLQEIRPSIDFSNTQISQPLDMESFDPFLAQNDLTLVAFGAPWCPYSQQLLPVLEETAKVIANVEGVRIGRVDCTQLASQSLCQKQHIVAFPTIVLYKGHTDHSHVQYNGIRTSEALLAFLVRAKQNSNLLTNPDEITSGDANAHAEAIARSLQLMNGPSDSEADPADPGPAWSLIEAIHKAGIHAPGDAARATKALLGMNTNVPVGNPTGNSNNLLDENTENSKRIEGCQVVGQLDLRRVSGTIRFVIKPTSTLSTTTDSEGNINIVNNSPVSVYNTNINTSHIIHQLWFGPKLTSYQLSRLPDNHVYEHNLYRLRNQRFVSTAVTGSNASHIHNVRIVPTQFTFRNGYNVDTFQYSSQSYATTSEETIANNNNEPSMIKLNYDLSSLAVSVSEVRKPFYSFLTSCCAIIGGVFTVVSLIDTVLHSIKQKLKRITGKHS